MTLCPPAAAAAAAAKFRRDSLFCPDELDSLFSYFDTGSGPRSKLSPPYMYCYIVLVIKMIHPILLLQLHEKELCMVRSEAKHSGLIKQSKVSLDKLIAKSSFQIPMVRISHPHSRAFIPKIIWMK